MADRERDVLEEVVETPTERARRNGAGMRLQPSSDGAAIRILTLLAEAVASRSLVWVTTLSSAGVWWWVVLHPSTLGIISASCATVSTLVPVLFRDAKEG